MILRLFLIALLAASPALAQNLRGYGLELSEQSANGDSHFTLLPPASMAADRTCQLEDDATMFDQCITPDLTDVWGCTSGNCNALTAAGGDSIDAALADSAKPFRRSATLPGTCTEGDTYHDTDSGGSELYLCTATNTWTKLTTAADINVQGTANEIASSGSGATPTLSIPSTFRITGKTATAPVKTGTSTPGSCTVGDWFFDTDATAGDNIALCTATDTWTYLDGTAGTGDIEAVFDCTTGDCQSLVAGAADSLNMTSAASSAPCKAGTSAPGTCSVGQCFFDTDASAGENLYGCTSTDTWTLLGDGGGGGGSGDIEAVWTTASGTVDALTAGAGDSFNATAADSSAPCKTGTSLPGSCTEGQCFQDTDSSGSEWYVCTAANTWTGVSSGITSAAARAYHDAAQSIAHNTTTTLAFNSERFDTNALHDTSTNNSRLTAPVDGIYLIMGHVSWAANATGIRSLSLQVNGTTAIGIASSSTASAGAFRQSVSTVYEMSAGDYVELIAYQNSTVSLNVEASGNFTPEFSMVLQAGQ